MTATGDAQATSRGRVLVRSVGRWLRRRRPRRFSFQRRFGLLTMLAVAAMICLMAGWWHGAIRRTVEIGGRSFGLDRLNVALKPGSSITIGRIELMQPAGPEFAEVDHIRLERATDGSIFVSNVASERRLELEFERPATPFDRLFGNTSPTFSGMAERFELASGPQAVSTVEVNHRVALRFENVSSSGFDLVAPDGENGRRFRYWFDGADDHVSQNGEVLGASQGEIEACASAKSFSTNLRWLFSVSSALIKAPEERIVLHIGGALSCWDGRAFYVAVPDLRGIEPLALTHDPARGRFFVSGRSRRQDAVFVFRRQARPDASVETIVGGSGIKWRVAAAGEGKHGGVRALTAGRTRYLIRDAGESAAGRAISLIAQSKIPLFPEKECGWFIANSAPPSDKTESVSPCPTPNARAYASGATVETIPSRPVSVLDRYLGGQASDSLNAGERYMRIGVVSLAVLLGFLLALPKSETFGWFGFLRRPGAALAIVWPLLVSGCLSLWPELVGSSNSADRAMFLTAANWGLAGVTLALVPRTGLRLGIFWVVATGLAAIGAVTMASMAIDGPTTHWASYIAKHKLLFLDVVPPFAIAVARTPFTVIRPVVAELVLGSRPSYRAVRWVLPVLLILAFVVWGLFGNQQGVAGIQPVELGKFASAIMVGALLVQWERGSKSFPSAPTRLSTGLSYLVVFLFVVFLYSVPFTHDDYSPLMIVTITFFVLGLSLVPHFWRWSWQRFAAFLEISRVPRRFRPPARERVLAFLPCWRPFLPCWRMTAGEKFVVVRLLPIVLAVIVMTFIYLAGGAVIAGLLGMRPPVWPAEREQQLIALEHALGNARFVPIQRFLTWVDLDYDAALGSRSVQTGTSSPVVRFPDLGHQVYQSRLVITRAVCPPSTIMLPTDGWAHQGVQRMRAATLVLAKFMGFDLSESAPLCRPLAETATDADTPQSKPLQLRDIAPIRVPVVQSDFAAAFLIGRHGVATGLFLIALQCAFVLMAAAALVRLRRTPQGDNSTMIIRSLLSVLVVGVTALFVLQWVLSWSNVLGLLPVVGQPMTWLSYGPSHHLFMALPGVLTILLAIRYTDIEPARRIGRAPPRE